MFTAVAKTFRELQQAVEFLRLIRAISSHLYCKSGTGA